MFLFFICSATTQLGPRPPHFEVPTSHKIRRTNTQSVRLLCTSDHPIAEAATYAHVTDTRDKRPCPQWESNTLDGTATNIGYSRA